MCHEFVPIEMRIAAWKIQETVFVPQERGWAVNNRPTTVLIYGKEIRSKEGDHDGVPKSFYPGLFISNRCYSDDMSDGIPLEATEIFYHTRNLKNFGAKKNIDALELIYWSIRYLALDSDWRSITPPNDLRELLSYYLLRQGLRQKKRSGHA
jgi:hypothetical protein